MNHIEEQYIQRLLSKPMQFLQTKHKSMSSFFSASTALQSQSRSSNHLQNLYTQINEYKILNKQVKRERILHTHIRCTGENADRQFLMNIKIKTTKQTPARF